MPKKRLHKRAMEKMRSLLAIKRNKQEKVGSESGEETLKRKVEAKPLKEAQETVTEKRQENTLHENNNTHRKKQKTIRFSRKAVQRNKYLREKLGVPRQVLGYCPRFCTIREEDEEESEPQLKTKTDTYSSPSRNRDHAEKENYNCDENSDDEDVYHEVSYLRLAAKGSNNYLGASEISERGDCAGDKLNENIDSYGKCDEILGKGIVNADEKADGSSKRFIECEGATKCETNAESLSDAQLDLSESTVLRQVKEEILAIWHRLVAIESDFTAIRSTVKELRRGEPEL
ncbi:predicted protein [Nematostella vectensis]|uniref:Uncharacterized protein n=1 Tax=Nematostella vectensis TaxID=45351 RepID=A7RF49_NEMVE|nr:uncharacterized protein LOC5522215 isoform X3 [Nematostella vectensis]XP_032223326.1 uncharacterized protein LOC5522215 isoform X3 [Nematostella vectensis]EDO49897.1 predicted protein [Nematostella vectensis]|eukprot:XP_001641960.1 predicted protein [Nematostella vectensis]